ncbi:MAG: RNA polymerase sigma factor [Hyphomicrobiales bacterium]|nr:RNA polymerase sigma factor [Hyphomicrobiales bacterium]
MQDSDRLLADLRSGDEAAFTKFVQRHNAALVGVAMSFVGSRAVAEEVVQETWLAIIEGLDRFEGRSSLTTWMYAILANKARTRAVREKRMVPLDRPTPDESSGGSGVDPARFGSNHRWIDPPAAIEEITPERVIEGRQLVELVREEIGRLPPRQRAVVLMRDVESMSSGEAAEVLGISEQNQRVLLHRGRARLRQFIEDASG